MADPVHRIGEVARRTGVTVDTLRIWERRYGFPRPRRAGSGVRLYADDDVRRLRLVRRALASGYRVGEVIGRPPEEIERLLEDRPDPPAPDVPRAPVPEAVAALLDHLSRYELDRMRARLRREASALGPVGFVREIATPLVDEIGERWACGALEIRQEHLLSEELSSQLRVLLAGLRLETLERSILLATLPGERHRLGLEMAALYAGARGLAPRLLGSDSPPRQIVEAALATGVDVVGVSCSAASDPESARAGLRWVADWLPGSIDLWVGGRGIAAVEDAAERARRMKSWDDVDAALGAVGQPSPADEPAREIAEERP